MVVIIFESGRIYDLNQFDFFVKVRPYTGAVGSGEGFCFVSGSLTRIQRSNVLKISEVLCDCFLKTGLSSGKGGPGIRMDEWFCYQRHTKTERNYYDSWKYKLDTIFVERLRSCDCTFDFLGSLGLRRRLNLLSFKGGLAAFVNTSCEFVVPEGRFDEYLFQRKMYLGVKMPCSDEVRSWLVESEKELASLSFARGSTSDVLLGRMFDLMDFGTAKFDLDLLLLSSTDVDYLKNR